MNNAIIVHGKPTEERYNNPDLPKPHEANWLPWIGNLLRESGVQTSIPAMPRPFFPVYKDWKEVFESNTININTGLIGHSAGAEFILRWLSENTDSQVDTVTLVAPYKDESGKYGDFSNYTLDASLVERVGKLTIFSSLDDSPAIQSNATALAKDLSSSQLIELNGYGHFMIGNNMTSPTFIELYQDLLN